jgi:capsular polysaccharide biosynthesis protein
MTNEISISMLLKVLKSAWWKILIFTLVITLIVAAFTIFVIPKKYASSVTFYVLNASSTSEYTNTSLLDAAPMLANDYTEIIRSDIMLDKISEYVKTDCDVTISNSAIKSMISSQLEDDKSAFTVTIVSTDPKLAFSIANAINEYAPDTVRQVSKPSYSSNLYQYNEKAGTYEKLTEESYECIKTINFPKEAKSPVSPNVVSNTLLAAIIAIAVSYAFFLVRKIFDTIIRGEETVKALIDLPMIGKIPTWDNNPPKNILGNNNVKEYK